MIIKKLTEFVGYVFGYKENFSIEKRIFLSSILIGILTCFVGAFVSGIITSQPVIVFLAILIACLLFIIYYLSRFKGIFKPFVVPIILLSFVAFSLIWIFGGGINGPNIMIGFVVLMLSLIVVSDKNKKYFLFIFIAIIVIIYSIQLYRPGLITKYPSESGRWVDTFITTIYCSFFIFLLIKSIHKNYTLERQRAEENEKKFRALSENSEDHITRINRQHRFIYINMAGIKAMGIAAENILGKSYRDIGIYNEEQTSMFEKTIKEVFVTKQPQFKQYSLETENGMTYYDWRLFPELNDKNEVISVLGVSHDITLLKQSEIELIRLNADKDLFMSILAHDLKNPFNTILGFSGLLVEELRTYDLDTIEEQIGIIHSTAQKTYDLFEDLLLWTKSQSGKLEFSPRKIDFVKTCQETIDKIRTNALAKNISVNYSSSEGILLWADENMLKTVLRNLLSNAIKFTNPGGQINIWTQQTPSNLTVTVFDNGVGIAPEIVNNIFRLSNRITTTGTANEKGTGLGLLLCKDFVEKHGGKIWVESVIGKGSEFKFTLPIFTGQAIKIDM
jgi:PAS domain S-box-containing protein